MRRSWSNRRPGSEERALVASLLAGDREPISQFLKDISPIVWASCRLLCRDEAEAHGKFIEIMRLLRADGFDRLRGYDGRGSLKTFVTLVVRDLLTLQILELLNSDRGRGWTVFAQFFDADIRRLISRRLPGPAYEDMRRESYQNICLALVEYNYERLRAYSGKGSFAGFVLRSIDNILIDLIRSRLSPRRRLPLPIARMSKLDQEVFKLVFWEHLPERADILAQCLRSRLDSSPELAEIESALARVEAHGATLDNTGHVIRIRTSPDDLGERIEPSPEDHLLQSEEDEQLIAALEVLSRAIETLPDVERLYLEVILKGTETPPSREIARIMQRSVEDIYTLKQRVLKRLRGLISEESAVKNWRASV